VATTPKLSAGAVEHGVEDHRGGHRGDSQFSDHAVDPQARGELGKARADQQHDRQVGGM